MAASDAEIEALRHVRDVENAELRAAVSALALRVAELERRLGSGSDDSGTPTSKEPIAARPGAGPNARPVSSGVGVVRRGSGRRTGRGAGSRAIPGMT